MPRQRQTIAKAQSADELAREAEDYDFSNNRNLRQWLRSGKQLLTEAAICEEDGDIQTAYVYLYRYADLVVEKLRGHPDYDDPRYRQDLRLARKDLLVVMPKLEQWKPKINQAHENYLQTRERREDEKRRAQRESQDDRSRRLSIDDFQRLSFHSRESSPSSPTYALDPHEHRQLALDFARSELERRRISKQAPRKSERSFEKSSTFVRNLPESDNDSRHAYYDGEPREHRSTRTTVTTYRYPSVPARKEKVAYDVPSPPSSYQARDLPPPARPAKEALYDYQTPEVPFVPARHPDSTARYRDEPPSIPPKSGNDRGEMSPKHPSSLDASRTQLLQSKYTFKTTAFTESGAPLRSLFLPSDLRATFLNLAHPNTARNLETCGILAGTLISGALFINHLIIPDQTSTSDTCDTTESGDNALFDYCDSHQLLVCGWIHTHPSQSCFLSSRDLHTSSGYQVMLPEAIAIVCAPRHNPDWGIFRLTSPPGLHHVLDCRQTGIFHPHTETNLYTDALRPGHVVEGTGLKFEVVDLREET